MFPNFLPQQLVWWWTDLCADFGADFLRRFLCADFCAQIFGAQCVDFSADFCTDFPRIFLRGFGALKIGVLESRKNVHKIIGKICGVPTACPGSGPYSICVLSFAPRCIKNKTLRKIRSATLACAKWNTCVFHCFPFEALAGGGGEKKQKMRKRRKKDKNHNNKNNQTRYTQGSKKERTK